MPNGPIPLMPGRWLALSETETHIFLERLTTVLSRTHGQAAFTKRLPIMALRALPLSFYPGWILVEGEAQVTGQKVGTFDVLYGPGCMWVIDGTSEAIHDLNIGRVPVVDVTATDKSNSLAKPSFLQSPLVELDPATTGPDYLRYFCGSVWSDDGPFTLVESADAPILEGAKATDSTWRDQIKPIRMTKVQEALIGEAVVAYSDRLCSAKFSIRGGFVRMDDDDPIMNVQLQKQEYLSPFRSLRVAEGKTTIKKDGR